MYLVYNFFFKLIFAFAKVLSLFSEKLRINLEIRKEQPDFSKINHDNSTYWFHAASVGEYAQVRAVAKVLKKKQQNINIVFSVFSNSAYTQCKEDEIYDLLFALPFDFKSRMKRLVRSVQPEIIFYARYDVWPNLASVANKSGVRQYIVSASLPSTSMRAKGLLLALNKKVFKNIDFVFAIDEENKRRLEVFGAPVIAMGDTRYDAIESRIKHDQSKEIDQLRNALPQNKNIVIGSSYSASEELWLKLFKQLDGYNLIMVPHHVDISSIDRLKSLCSQIKVGYSLFSDWLENRNAINGILIVDKTGYLARLYSLGSIAYVGGGFQRGIHSVIEPAFFGLPIITGPKIENSQEALDLAGSHLLWRLSDSSETQLKAILDQIRNNISIRRQIMNYFKARLGASERIVDFILRPGMN